MKLFQKWLREEPAEAGFADKTRNSSVESASGPAHAKGDEYDENSSYMVEEDAELGDTVPARTLSLCESQSLTDEDDAGNDPYNTIRSEVTE